MKTKLSLLLLGGLTLAAVAGLVAVQRQFVRPVDAGRARIFQVNGVIRSLEIANHTVRIAHEEIPGYMPAMSMPLTVKDAALLRGFASGDRVQFELMVTETDSWISRLEKISAEPSASAGDVAGTTATVTDREAERLQVGEVVPGFDLVDQDGRPIRWQDYRGKAVLVTFIYTRCPLPNYCPLMSKNFAELQRRLSKEFPGSYRLLSISIDPEFDTPAVLKEYAARYEARAEDWAFATGAPEQIEAVARALGLYYARENGLISHDLRTALIGPDGRLVHLWKSNVWTPYEVQRLVRETLSGAKDVAVR